MDNFIHKTRFGIEYRASVSREAEFIMDKTLLRIVEIHSDRKLIVRIDNSDIGPQDFISEFVLGYVRRTVDTGVFHLYANYGGEIPIVEAHEILRREQESKPETDIPPPDTQRYINIGSNTGHGYAWERPDGGKNKCGGPALCATCRADQGMVEEFNRRVKLANGEVNDETSEPNS